MKTAEKTEQKSLTDVLSKTNWLLTGIVIVLTIGVFFQMLTYFSVWDIKDSIYDGFKVIYDRMGRMRVY